MAIEKLGTDPAQSTEEFKLLANGEYYEAISQVAWTKQLSRNP